MRCFLCKLGLQISSHGICSQCFKNLPRLNKICEQCALPHSLDTPICYRCLSNKPYYDNTTTAFGYEAPIKNLINAFKFNQRIELSYALSRLIFLAWFQKWMENQIKKPDIITCVPLHHIRYWSRGFNQAELLARNIAKWIDRPFLPHLLRRKKLALDQKKLSIKGRRSNVNALFYCQNNLKNQSIMVVDDIITTGNTVNAISQQLKNCGAIHVQIICVCRTLL